VKDVVRDCIGSSWIRKALAVRFIQYLVEVLLLTILDEHHDIIKDNILLLYV